MEQWNKEDASSWAKTWNEPHMQKGLRQIMQASKPRPPAGLLAPNIDYTSIAALRAAAYEGRQEILDVIEYLKGEVNNGPINLPEPYAWVEEQDKKPNKEK
jgi:hypothetical protein